MNKNRRKEDEKFVGSSMTLLLKSHVEFNTEKKSPNSELNCV